MLIRRRLLRILDNRRTVHARLSRRRPSCLLVLALARSWSRMARPRDVSARLRPKHGLATSRRPEERRLRHRPRSAARDEPASYRPGAVWHQAAQGRDGPRGEGTASSSARAVVLALAYSPDGTTLASAGDDAVVVLRDVASGRVVGRLEGHGDAVSCLAFSPDGQTLATGSYDRTVKLWDVATGREQATLSGHTNWVFAVAFAPDGKSLASAGHDKTVRIWDAATGRETATLAGPLGLGPGRGLRAGRAADVGWPPAGRIAWSCSGTWTTRGRPRPPRGAQGDGPRPRVLARRRDARDRRRGRRGEAVGPGLGPRAGDAVGPLRHGDVPGVLAPRRDPRHRQPRHDREALGDRDRPGAGLAPGTPRRRLGPGLRADARQMATGGFDGSVRLWEPAAPIFSPAACLAYPGEARGLAFSPDGRSLRAAGDGRASPAGTPGPARPSRRRRAPGRRRRRSPRPPTAPATRPGMPDGKVRLFDADSDRVIATFGGHAGAVRSIGLFARLPPDRLGRPGRDRLPLGRPPAGGSWATFPAPGGPIACVRFSPDGRTLAVATGRTSEGEASSSAAVTLWDVAARRQRGTLQCSSAGPRRSRSRPTAGRIATAGPRRGRPALGRRHSSAARHADVCRMPVGRVLARRPIPGLGARRRRRGPLGRPGRPAARPAEGASRPGHSGRLLARRPLARHGRQGPDGEALEPGHAPADGTRDPRRGTSTPVWSVAYSPDGKTLAVADGPLDTPGTVTLWDVATRKVKATLDGHERGVATVVFSPDGTTARLGRLGRHDPDLGRPRPARPRHVLDGPQRRHRAGVLARRPAAGLGRRGEHRHALGRRDRHRGVPADRTSAGPSSASPSRPTARSWRPVAAPSTTGPADRAR